MLEFIFNAIGFGAKKANPTIIDPSDIIYAPVVQSLISQRVYIKQPMRTVYPPEKVSFNDVFINAHEQLNKR